MEVFFVCITLVGSVLVLFSLMLMLAEKRRFHDYREDIAERTDELIEIIEDAEILIQEMNRFSVYTVSKLEEKYELLNKAIREADGMIRALNFEDKTEPANSAEGAAAETDSRYMTHEADPEFKMEGEASVSDQPDGDENDKVVSYDERRKEIIKLSKSGMDSAQIARLLNMGRGEIELIAKIGR